MTKDSARPVHLWPAKPHTLAKHRILQAYLAAWIPILTRHAERSQRENAQVLLVDGFAGPGEYLGGEKGSPIIALEAALNHSQNFPIPVRFVFVEDNPEHFQHLKQVLKRYSTSIAKSQNVLVDPPVKGDCDVVLSALLTDYESKGIKFGPALVFLDQFGYSQVSLCLVRRILRFPSCEVFMYFNYSHLSRFLTDKTKWPALRRTFGGDEWQAALDLRGYERERCLLSCYRETLQKRAKATYVWYFSMRDEHDKLLNWLFFCTQSLRGLEEMKRAMWQVDQTGSFHFSDKAAIGQMALFREHTDAWLANHLAIALAGQTATVQKIKEYVLLETPCYKFANALRKLHGAETIRVLNPPPNWRGGFAKNPGLMVEFSRPGTGLSS